MRQHDDRIESIHNYCDRWCERCAYTLRCAVYAVEAATEMCGSPADGFELALGRPHPAGGAAPAAPTHDEDEEEEEAERVAMAIDTAEVARAEKAEKAREERLERSPLMRLAFDYTVRAIGWLRATHDQLAAGGDPVLLEALAIVGHDAAFVAAKIHRALSGRGRLPRIFGRAVQSDANGSAKVALISLGRSAEAWRAIAHATGDDDAVALGERASDLRQLMLEHFPDAPRFVRPGFDEPWR